MSKRRKRKKGNRRRQRVSSRPGKEARFSVGYQQAIALAIDGNYTSAETAYTKLLDKSKNSRELALVHNDLAVLNAIQGDVHTARIHLTQARELDAGCHEATENLATLDGRPPGNGQPSTPIHEQAIQNGNGRRCKIAILSFLFNWPSTGGGIIHTVELAKFLELAGYSVKHFFARYAPWGIGQTDETLPATSEAIEFDDRNWSIESIQDRFRDVVSRFDPDYVIITDCWNFKPYLAEAVSDWPYFLRQQALECICPLNNVRLLVESGNLLQCDQNQFANPGQCYECLSQRESQTGGLHRAERALCNVGSEDYEKRLRAAFAKAEAVLVLNPMQRELLTPFAKNVHVVTWGMDPDRFPWPAPNEKRVSECENTFNVLMAGVIDEPMKGFSVLREASSLLWQKRNDFRLIATGEPNGNAEPFIHFTGWLSQDELVEQLRCCDLLVMPTLAQEGLGRTTVEAMATGKPVIASDIGGLPFTVSDGVTGLLCKWGDPVDLAAKIERLMDNPDLCKAMGKAARRRFEQEFAWPVVIREQYEPLLKHANVLNAPDG